MPYPLLSSLHLPILICINYYYHLKNLGLTSLSYYHSVTVNVLLNHALSPCLSGSLLSDVHHIICYSIMHCSAVYLDPFYSSRIFCNASSPIFFMTMHSCHIQSPLYYSPGVSCHWKKYIFLFYFILFYFTMTTADSAEVPPSLSILYRKLWLSQSSFLCEVEKICVLRGRFTQKIRWKLTTFACYYLKIFTPSIGPRKNRGEAQCLLKFTFGPQLMI